MGFLNKTRTGVLKEFYKFRGVECEPYYVEIGDETRKYRLNKRNKTTLAEKTSVYNIYIGLKK